MWKFEIHRRTDLNVECLWNALTRFEDWPNWASRVRRVRHEETPSRPGARFRIDRRFGIPKTYRVDQFHRPSRLTFSYRTGFGTVRTTYSLYQKESGADLNAKIELKGGLSTLLGFMRGRWIKNDLVEETARLLDYARELQRTERLATSGPHFLSTSYPSSSPVHKSAPGERKPSDSKLGDSKLGDPKPGERKPGDA